MLILLLDLFEEISRKFKYGGDIRLPVDVCGDMFIPWLGNKYSSGMHLVIPSESPVSEKTFANEAYTQAFIVLHSRHRAEIAITFEVCDLVEIGLI